MQQQQNSKMKVSEDVASLFAAYSDGFRSMVRTYSDETDDHNNNEQLYLLLRSSLLPLALNSSICSNGSASTE